MRKSPIRPTRPTQPRPTAADSARREQARAATLREGALPSALLAAALYTFFAYPPNADFPYLLFFPAVVLAIVALCRAVRRNVVLPTDGKAGRRARRWGVAILGVGIVGVFVGAQGWAAWRVGGDADVARAAANGFPASDTSPTLYDATVAMEDGLFYRHHGFDWAAMHHALRVNVRAGKVRQGGSTITQQLAKNLFLVKDRTVARKLMEFPLTVELERRLTKPQLLALYVHSIDYGMGQHGVANAARFYFDKTPDRLTLSECALLVGIVPHDPRRLPSDATLDAWRDRALRQIGGRFGDRYPSPAIDAAGETPIRELIVAVRQNPPALGGRGAK